MKLVERKNNIREGGTSEGGETVIERGDGGTTTGRFVPGAKWKEVAVVDNISSAGAVAGDSVSVRKDTS